MGSEERHNCEDCANGCKALLWVLSEAVPETLGSILYYSEKCEGWQPRED